MFEVLFCLQKEMVGQEGVTCCCVLFKMCKKKMKKDKMDGRDVNVTMAFTCCASRGNNNNALGNQNRYYYSKSVNTTGYETAV